MNLAFNITTFGSTSIGYIKKNNNKGFTIKLTNEIAETNNLLLDKIKDGIKFLIII